MTTGEIDRAAADFMAERSCKSAFLGYRGFPGQICISINEEVVHGIGGSRELRDGDIVKIDVGILTRDGWVGDNAKTVPAGTSPPKRPRCSPRPRHRSTPPLPGRGGERLSSVCSAVEEPSPPSDSPW